MDETAPQTGGEDIAELLAALAPRDALEAMLAAQMAAVHAAALRATQRAAECTDHPQIEALYLRQAARLMHLFTRQMEALDRRRIAAEERADMAAREARVEDKLQRQEDEQAMIFGRAPARRRRRAGSPGGARSAAPRTLDELAAGLYDPDPMPG